MSNNAVSLLSTTGKMRGEVQGTEYIQDSETGFLKLGDGSNLFYFQPSRKIQFLEVAKGCDGKPGLWPDISAICEVVGIKRSSFENHYNLDTKFREECDAIQKSITDKIHAKFTNKALEDSHRSTLPQIVHLKAYMPERYNPDSKLQVNHSITHETVEAKKATIKDILEAEIIGENQPGGNP